MVALVVILALISLPLLMMHKEPLENENINLDAVYDAVKFYREFLLGYK